MNFASIVRKEKIIVHQYNEGAITIILCYSGKI